MDIRSHHLNLFLSLIFFFILVFVQSIYFFNNGLGVLSLYDSYPLAFNEFTFWSQYQSEIFNQMEYSNPMLFNLIGLFINFMASLFSGKIIFTLLPVFFTSFSFYLFLKILDDYAMPKHWSFLIAFLGLTSSTNSTLWFLIANFFSIYPGNTSEVFNHFDLLISLSTSISLFVFLLLVNPISKLYQITYRPPKFLSVFLGISIYIHPSIFFFSLVFLIFNLFIRAKRAISLENKSNLKEFFPTLVIPIIIAAPYIYLNFNFYNGLQTDPIDFDTSLIRELVVYCLFPFGMMYISSIVFKIDPFEVTIRFLPILILSLGEAFLRTFARFENIGFNVDFILDNISVYFLHFFYYVPLISIISRRSYHEFKSEMSLDKFFLNLRLFLNSALGFAFIPILVLSVFIIFIPILHKTEDGISDEITLKIQNVIDQANLASPSSENIIILDSLESNLILNFLNRDNPFLNNFLINGNQDISSYHSFFWKVYKYNDYKNLRNLKPSENNFLMNSSDRENKIFFWLLSNRYYLTGLEDDKIANNCSEDFFKNFTLVTTKKMINKINSLHPQTCEIFIQ